MQGLAGKVTLGQLLSKLMCWLFW